MLNSCSERWPQEIVTPSLSVSSGVREAYLARHAALLGFQFSDPLAADIPTEAKPVDHILLEKDDIIFSQVSITPLIMFCAFEF